MVRNKFIDVGHLTDAQYEMVKGFFKFNNIKFKGVDKRKEIKQMGRKRIDFPPMWDMIYYQWKHKEITSPEAMRMSNLKKTTFYKLIKEYEGNQIKFEI